MHLPDKGWTENAGCEWTTVNWNSKSIGQCENKGRIFVYVAPSSVEEEGKTSLRGNFDASITGNAWRGITIFSLPWWNG